ncbi:18891_t:CDS:1, partial [Rhizophagus irregularis]
SINAEIQEFSRNFRSELHFLPSQRYVKNPQKRYKARSTDVFWSYDSPYTSEDTKNLEFRPNKRDVNTSYELSSHYGLAVQKRSRQDLSSIIDSTVAGSSKCTL